jgi:hypothetical protein
MKWLAVLLLSLNLMGCALRTGSPTLAAMHGIGFRISAGVLPRAYEVPGESHAKYYENLKGWAKRRTIALAFVPDLRLNDVPLSGLTRWTKEGGVMVFLDSQEPVNNQFYTLIHELAHVYQARNLTYPAAETFAELVAVQVAAKVGLKTADYTAQYMAGTATIEFQWRVIDGYYKEIDTVVLMLTAAAQGAN